MVPQEFYGLDEWWNIWRSPTEFKPNIFPSFLPWTFCPCLCSLYLITGSDLLSCPVVQSIDLPHVFSGLLNISCSFATYLQRNYYLYLSTESFICSVKSRVLILSHELAQNPFMTCLHCTYLWYGSFKSYDRYIFISFLMRISSLRPGRVYFSTWNSQKLGHF